MSRQLNSMLSRLLTVYGSPKETENVTAFMGEYARQMDGFTDSELEEATNRLLRRRKFKTWPTIQECLDALEEVRKGQTAKRQADVYTAKMVQQAKALEPKQLSPAEQRAAEQYVDDVASGKIPDIELGLCAAALRRVAVIMRDKRRARA